MDQLRRMEVFVKLVNSGQFTQAAKQLSLSKSTVSHSIAELERYLGLQLVKRNSRTLSLTKAGQVYYEDCVRILDEINLSEDRVRGEARAITGSIRMTAPISFGTYVLTPILGRFMADNPDISVNMMLAEKRLDLISEGIDLALRVGTMPDSRLLSRKIGDAKMVLCAAPSYLAQRGRPSKLSDLDHHELLAYSRSPTWRLCESGVEVEIEPKGRLQTNNGENLREFGVAGLGIVYMPNVIAAPALESGRLVQIMPAHTSEPIDIHLVRPAGRHTPMRIKKLMNFIIADFKSKGPL
ncbi:LysR family transcriptional regulator [Litorimonas sp. WD9-15]|uniref:LysR family transcriptional regulator n=1 Tax=Litorimonas sp. WD9-15 TaxID=3418716 RepID=UPI003D00AC64